MNGYACDWEENSERFYQNNFPEVPFDRTDVRNVTLARVNEVREKYGLQAIVKGETDVLSAGSPCVKVAACNTVDARDFAPENSLMYETLPKIVRDLEPKIAVFENSDRLCSKGKEVLLMEYIASIQNLLPQYGYCIRVLNAKRYGAFQSRSRSIVILIRRDVLNNITEMRPLHPPKNKIDLSVQGVDALMPWVVEFSAGQFKAKFKPAKGNIFCTITANTCQQVREADKEQRKISLNECKILTGMTEQDFTGICATEQYRLLGNMVMRQLTTILFRNFKHFL